MNHHLSGKVAWVTGGASGMGRATALRLARAGADVAIGSLVLSQRGAALPDQNVHTPADEALESTRAKIEALGARCLALALNVCAEESVQASYEAITSAFGRIDILVNAAGSSARKLIADHPDDIWHRIVDTNLNGPFQTIRRCFPGMVGRRWGRIVNFASTAANVGYPRHSAYCASKSGLLGLTRAATRSIPASSPPAATTRPPSRRSRSRSSTSASRSIRHASPPRCRRSASSARTRSRLSRFISAATTPSGSMRRPSR
jgi:3-hydroxybutyrate dehydrogenase